METWEHGSTGAREIPRQHVRKGERRPSELRISCCLQRTWIDNFLVDKVRAQKDRHFLKSTIRI